MPNKNTLTWRVEQLEGRVNSMDKKIDDILQNHLPSLEKRLIRLETRINILTAANIGAIVLGLIFNKFL